MSFKIISFTSSKQRKYKNCGLVVATENNIASARKPPFTVPWQKSNIQHPKQQPTHLHPYAVPEYHH